jgi:hypothetical protein
MHLLHHLSRTPLRSTRILPLGDALQNKQQPPALPAANRRPGPSSRAASYSLAVPGEERAMVDSQCIPGLSSIAASSRSAPARISSAATWSCLATRPGTSRSLRGLICRHATMAHDQSTRTPPPLPSCPAANGTRRAAAMVARRRPAGKTRPTVCPHGSRKERVAPCPPISRGFPRPSPQRRSRPAAPGQYLRATSPCCPPGPTRAAHAARRSGASRSRRGRTRGSWDWRAEFLGAARARPSPWTSTA